MDIKEILKRLYDDESYKEWKKEHADDFLAHVFVMCDDANKDLCQVGFYNKETDAISSFLIEPDKIALVPDQEIFRHPGAEIKALNPENISITSEQALEKAADVKKEKYSSFSPMKQFFIIQNIDGKDVYNMTFVSTDLQTLNIRITGDGEVLEDSVHNLVDFDKSAEQK